MSDIDFVNKYLKDFSSLLEPNKDLIDKINQGRGSIRNMESSVGQIEGAIQQCNWTIDELELKDDEAVAKK